MYKRQVVDFWDKTWDEDGYIILGGSAEIDNVKTDTGKTYEIIYGLYATVRDHPEYEGVTDLLVIDTEKQEQVNMEDKEIDLSDAQKSVGYDDVYWEW